MIKDEYCAKAIGAQLELDESGSEPWTQVAALATFLQDCMREGTLAEGWVPNARTLLESIYGTRSQAFSKLI